MNSSEVLRTLRSSDFNYPAWKIDQKLVKKHAVSDIDAAIFRLDIMKRRQEMNDGHCLHPLYFQILDKQWKYPGSESDLEVALNYFKHGRDEFVLKILSEGDRKNTEHSRRPFTPDTVSTCESDGKHQAGTNEDHSSAKKSADNSSTFIMVMKPGEITGSLKKVQEFNRRARKILEEDNNNQPGSSLEENRHSTTQRSVLSENQSQRSTDSSRDSYPDGKGTSSMNNSSVASTAILVTKPGDITGSLKRVQDFNRRTRQMLGEDDQDDAVSESPSSSVGSYHSESSTSSALVAEFRDKILKEREHLTRRGIASRNRRRRYQESSHDNHALIQSVEEKAWTYPSNEEDKKAAKFYAKSGLEKMVEKVLILGDTKENSYRSLRNDQCADNEVLVALDSFTFSYPGWEDDMASIAEIFLDKEKSFRILDLMKAKQNLHELENCATE